MTRPPQFVKRLPPKLFSAPNDFYVTRKTKLPAQLKECTKLLDKKFDEVIIHALGNAINRAIILSQALDRSMKGLLKFDVQTSSVNVTDDVVPLLDDDDIDQTHRVISAIHIIVSRRDTFI